MKTNKKIGIVALLAFVALGSYFIAGTYAKYISTVAGTDTTSVAKWAWQINNETITSAQDVTNGYTFDLFDTIKDLNTTNPYGVSSSDETDVDESGDPLIAPGTGGSFELEITNLSEVNATYAIAFTETNSSNIPIEYSVNGTTWVSAVDSLDVSATDIAMAGGTYNTADDTDTLTVYWRWAFIGAESINYTSASNQEQTDATDTALGFAANTTRPTVTVTANVTFTQVN